MMKDTIFNNYSLPSSTGSIDTYITHVMSIPALSKAQEIELAKNLDDANDLEAAKKINYA